MDISRFVRWATALLAGALSALLALTVLGILWTFIDSVRPKQSAYEYCIAQEFDREQCYQWHVLNERQ